MQTDSIICFAKDWHEPKTSVNHVMEELAKTHRILWVNSIAMRSANFASARDWKKIFRKLRTLFRGMQQPLPNLRVFTPLVIPLPNSRLAQAINRRLLRWGINRAAKRWGLQRPQLWIFQPNAVDFIGEFHESLVVYYCVDDFSGFSYLNAKLMRQKEQNLTARANVVFVTARKLLDQKLAQNPHTYLVPHAVNHELFAQALVPDCVVPVELQRLPRPIIGYYGNLYDWVDQELLAALAQARPAWSFVLVGKIMSEVSVLQAQRNIHLLGPRSYEELPAYCKGFDVGIIPYKTADPRMQSVNPLKLREYLAAGLPVVSVDLPEVHNVCADVRVAHTVAEFLQQIEAALAQNSSADRCRRSQAMLTETWSARMATIEQHLANLPVVNHV